MFEKGQKVKVSHRGYDLARGHTGHVTRVDEISAGSPSVLVVFDDPADEGWAHWLSDFWFYDYELEAVDG